MIVKDSDVLLDGEVPVAVLVRLVEGLQQLVVFPAVVALLQHQAHGRAVNRHCVYCSVRISKTQTAWTPVIQIVFSVYTMFSIIAVVIIIIVPAVIFILFVDAAVVVTTIRQ